MTKLDTDSHQIRFVEINQNTIIPIENLLDVSLIDHQCRITYRSISVDKMVQHQDYISVDDYTKIRQIMTRFGLLSQLN